MKFLRRKKAEDNKVLSQGVSNSKVSRRSSVCADISGIIIRPLVTEKVANLASQDKYVFEVSKEANAFNVKAAFESIYKICPTQINIQNYRGDFVTFGRNVGRQRYWKKAIITLPKGSKLDVYESK
jgi:large subunit ribosomal protein L23